MNAFTPQVVAEMRISIQRGTLQQFELGRTGQRRRPSTITLQTRKVRNSLTLAAIFRVKRAK
jgi:hypothetical protein